MNKLTLAFATTLISISALAETYNQKLAHEMAVILQSKELSPLLSQEDGPGTLQGIKYNFSGRASFGPSHYEISFKDHSGPSPQVCSTNAQLNIETMQVISLSQPVCH